MKIKLDLNFDFVDIAGAKLEGQAPAGRFLAVLLAGSNTGDALKQWEWATKLAKDGILELEDSDFVTLEKFVKDAASATTLSKAQVLQAMLNARLTKP